MIHRSTTRVLDLSRRRPPLSLLVFVGTIVLGGCKGDVVNPVSSRYYFLTSPSVVTLDDTHRVFGAPQGHVVIGDDCAKMPTDAFDASLSAQDNIARKTDRDPAIPKSPWLRGSTDVDESTFSYVTQDTSVSFSGKATFATSGRADLNASLQEKKLELVLANIRRRVDVSDLAIECLKSAALRACDGSSRTLHYPRAFLYGALVRVSGQKLTTDDDGKINVGDQVSFKVTSKYAAEDVSGGFVGKLNSSLLAGKDIVSDIEHQKKFDVPEMIELARENRVIELGTKLDTITERYGVVAVEMEALTCPVKSVE